MKNYVKIFFVILLCSISLTAQEKGLLSLNKLFSSGEYYARGAGQVQWIGEGDGYAKVERSQTVKGGSDIVTFDVQTGTKEVLVTADKMIPKGKDTPIAMENFQITREKDMMLIFTNSERVWRQNTRGDYWLLNIKTGELFQLGKNLKASSLMFATISPDKKKAAYVSQNNIYMEDLKSHKITKLTKDGSTTIINGTFDWVYEEEFDCRNGIRWSPDSKKIAFWQLDASGVGVFNLINNTDSIYSKIIPVQYPKAGTTNSACKVGSVDVATGKITWMKVPGDPRNNYIARMEWASSSDEVLIQHLNRLQNTNELMLCKAADGSVKTVFTDKDKAWVEVCDNILWLNGGKAFTFVSEKEGWNNIYVISRDGSDVKNITPGNFDVISVQAIDEKGGYVYYIASPDNPIQRYLYRSKLNGEEKPERLSPTNQSGTHRYSISTNYKWALHTFSNINTPPVSELISLPDHKQVRLLEDNAALKNKMAELKIRPAEFFKIEVEKGVFVDGYMIKPYDFDPAKKYPVFFNVYGEPASTTVNDSWGISMWHYYLTQQGYIIISIDNRGTPSPKGREWRKSIYGQIGILASKDQAAAAMEICKWDFVDASRIGIWGWSGGGSMTLNMLFRYPDIYSLGIAVASVPDESLYDTIYQERYMGLPSSNPEGYKEGSAINHAKNLKGKLLLIHGTGDDNVHYQGCERLINELVKNNKLFSLMVYPNRTHGIYEGPGTTMHLYNTMTNYLFTNMKPGPVSK